MPERLAGALLLLAAALAPSALPAAEAPPVERRAELVHLLRQDCGSCHGMTLKGGLGPSLLPEALDGKDAESLAYIILHGVRGTPMPPWAGELSPEEARWLAEALKTGIRP
jgi:cytochrome c55X